MPENIHGRSFLKLLDFSPNELRNLLRLAASLKEAKSNGTEKQLLKGKNIALIFEKNSTRSIPQSRGHQMPVAQSHSQLDAGTPHSWHPVGL